MFHDSLLLIWHDHSSRLKTMILAIRERSSFMGGGGGGANPKIARTQNLPPPSEAMH